MVQPIFDDVLIRNVNVAPVAITILAALLVKGVCSYLSTTLVAAVGQRAVTDLRNALYKHVLNQSFTFLTATRTGSLMSHITTDVERIQNAVSEVAGDVLKEGLAVLGLVIILFVKDWRLALFSLVGHAGRVLPAGAAGPAPARLERDLAAALARHLRDPAGDDLRLPRGEGLRHGGLRDRALPARGPAGSSTSTCASRAPRAVLPPLMEAVGGLALIVAPLLRQPRDPQRAG